MIKPDVFFFFLYIYINVLCGFVNYVSNLSFVVLALLTLGKAMNKHVRMS